MSGAIANGLSRGRIGRIQMSRLSRSCPPAIRQRSERLPRAVRALFWSNPGQRILWPVDWDDIILGILSRGDLRAIAWLRKRVADQRLRAWVLAHRGRGLSPQRLRFWQAILELPPRQVASWIRLPGRPAIRTEGRS